jgi:hypothetical protein
LDAAYHQILVAFAVVPQGRDGYAGWLTSGCVSLRVPELPRSRIHQDGYRPSVRRNHQVWVAISI